MTKTVDPFFDGYRHLKPLPDSTLRDLARNESAPRDYRKAAVEILWGRKSPYVRHEDLKEFVEELEIELDGIQLEFPAPESKPMSASVTTSTLYSEPFDEHKSGFTGFDFPQGELVREMDEDEKQNSPNEGVSLHNSLQKKTRKKKEVDASEST